jgi:hypothetical protein
MKPKVLASIFLGAWLSTEQAMPQAPTLGKNPDDVVKLAVKEGKVHVGSGLTAEEASIVLKGFKQKYPTIKADVTPVSGTARAERVFNEALAGVVEFDLYETEAVMQVATGEYPIMCAH